MIERNIKELLEAVEDFVVNRGSYSGPTTNSFDENACNFIEAAERRIRRMAEAAKRVRGSLFVLTEYDLRFAHFLLGALVDKYSDDEDLIDAEELVWMSNACLREPLVSFQTSKVHEFLQKKVKDRL